MWSMWNAPSDLDYYIQSGFGDDEPEEEELEAPLEDCIEPLEAGPETEPYDLLPQRAAAALRAISWRCSLVRARARALPPSLPALRAMRTISSLSNEAALANPPSCATALRSFGDIFFMRWRARATAAGFFL